MVTASDLPFQLQVIKRFPCYSIQEAQLFSNSKKEVWDSNIITLKVEENDEVEILFSSDDPNARLYMEALDIIPSNGDTIKIDENGLLYHTVSNSSFYLYKRDDQYDALCVDTFPINIFCFDKWYYGTFQVLPKQLNMNEWIMMKDDLEQEVTGLAQDIVRRNIGLGSGEKGNIPPKMLYDFLVIKNYSASILNALLDIAENPRYKIVTRYKYVLNAQNHRLDSESMRRYVTRAGSEATFKVPEKQICYDIQDNRLLKRIIIDYDNRLNEFIKVLSSSDIDKELISGSMYYRNEWKNTIAEFINKAMKLKKITSLLKTKDWYIQIKQGAEFHVPHSFILDSRYNTLYQMYLDLKSNTFDVQLDPEFSYAWKRSSYLYEMWSYLKVIRLLANYYELDSKEWNQIFMGNLLFPFISSGTSVILKGKSISLKIVYDKIISFDVNSTNIDDPLYVARTGFGRQHNRPDIIIHVYSEDTGWFLGSIILECKYRKLKSFWRGGSEGSSVGQFQAYYISMRSNFHFNGYGKPKNILPVRKVVVLTPDEDAEGVKNDDFEIIIKSFKPSEDKKWEKSFYKELELIINEMKGDEKLFQ